jgi:hypothetical protein
LAIFDKLWISQCRSVFNHARDDEEGTSAAEEYLFGTVLGAHHTHSSPYRLTLGTKSCNFECPKHRTPVADSRWGAELRRLLSQFGRRNERNDNSSLSTGIMPRERSNDRRNLIAALPKARARHGLAEISILRALALESEWCLLPHCAHSRTGRTFPAQTFSAWDSPFRLFTAPAGRRAMTRYSTQAETFWDHAGNLIFRATAMTLRNLTTWDEVCLTRRNYRSWRTRNHIRSISTAFAAPSDSDERRIVCLSAIPPQARTSSFSFVYRQDQPVIQPEN